MLLLMLGIAVGYGFRGLINRDGKKVIAKLEAEMAALKQMLADEFGKFKPTL